MDELERLSIIREAAYGLYDSRARNWPDCEHNRAWRRSGPGRPPIPLDCQENLDHYVLEREAWREFRRASQELEEAAMLEQEIFELIASEFEHEADAQDLMEAEQVSPEMLAASFRRVARNIRARLLPG